MDIGKIIGTIVAPRKDPSLVGGRLLIVQPLDERGESVGSPLVAVDTQGTAGYGDLIYMVTGGDATVVSSTRQMPVDVAVVGIVDSITTTEEAEA
jgi:ethanolamine utilization protein EutN